MEFNKNQIEAINFNLGRCQVIAGPGSGKTVVLIERTLRLIKSGIKEDRIIIFTFTNKACDEIRNRLKKALGYIPKVSINTFHSFAYTFLKALYNPKDAKKLRLLMPDEQRRIIAKLIKENNYPLKDAEVVRAFSGIRNEFKVYLTEINRLRVADLYFKYEEYMNENLYMDFDSMVHRLVTAMELNEDLADSLSSSFDYIMVDECQDINNIQFKMLMMLEQSSHNLFMVGDPDQSIYGWRGSNMKLIKEFMENYNATRIDLGDNYRSDKYIVDISSYMIGKNNERVDLKLHATLPAINEPIFNEYMTPEDEAYSIANEVKKLHKEGVPYNEILILTRENSDSDPIEIAFKRNKIPLSKDVISFFDREEIKTIYNHYNLILNHDDDLAFEYISSRPAKGIQIKKIIELSGREKISFYEASKRINNQKTNEFAKLIDDLTSKMKIMEPIQFFDYLLEVTHLDEYRNFNTEKAQQNIATFRDLLVGIKGEDYITKTKEFLTDVVFTKAVTNETDGSVRTMTIHQAKGLEAKVVFMPSMVNKYGIVDYNEEERRINYVAATRAKEKLYCSTYMYFNSQSIYSLRPTFYYNELKYAQKQIEFLKR